MAGTVLITREYLSIKELSEYSGVCVRTLRDKVNASDNPIPAYRFGGSIKVKRSEFDQWASSCRIDNDRVKNIVDEVLCDFGVKGKKRRGARLNSNSKTGMNTKTGGRNNGDAKHAAMQ